MIAAQVSPKRRENQVFDLERKGKVVEDNRAGNSQSRKKSTCLTIGLEEERPGKDLTRRQESRQMERKDVTKNAKNSSIGRNYSRKKEEEEERR